MPVEQAVTCGWFPAKMRDAEIAAAMGELQALCRAAGAVVVGQAWQRRPAPDRRTLVGQGKVEELQQLIAACGAALVVFNNVLTTLQQRNLEDTLRVKVIDRSRLILDIFATRARSQEGEAAGRAGAAPLPAAPPHRQGHRLVPPRRRHTARAARARASSSPTAG